MYFPDEDNFCYTVIVCAFFLMAYVLVLIQRNFT